MNHLHDRLHQAADDTDKPLTTDVAALLGRARATRQRQRRLRAGGTLGGVAALTAAAVLVVPALSGGSSPAPPSDPAPSRVAEPADSAKTTVLPDAEIVRRCEPQLQKYYDYPMYQPERWRVAHDRDYVVGDVVQLDGGSRMGSNPVLCEIPEEGKEQREVPFDRFMADGSDPARLTELCSETALNSSDSVAVGGSQSLPPEVDARSESIPDLRGGQVLAVDGDADVTVALIGLGGQHFACVLSSLTWDAGLTDVHGSGRGDVYLNGGTTGSTNKSIVDGPASYYTGAGLTDPDARTIRVTFPDGHVEERPVHDGAYAVMIRIAGEGGLLETNIEVLGAGDRVLEQFPPM